MEFKKFNFRKNNLFKSSKAFGVDFNERTLRIMQLGQFGKNQKVVGWNEKKIPRGILESNMIMKKEEFGNFFIDVIRKSKGKIKGSQVVVSIPENKIFTRIIKIPLMEENEAEESIRFETESNIPISIDEAYFDWQIVEKREKEMDVLVVVSPMKIIDNYLEVFSKINYQVIAFEPKSISAGRSIINLEDKNEYNLVVDMGLNGTNFAIYKNNFPVLTSSGLISGKILTDVVMKHKGLSIEKAESYKIKVGLGSNLEEKEESFAIFGSSIKTLVEEIKRALNFFEENLINQLSGKKDLKKKTINKIIFTGGGSNLKGLSSYLAINLQEQVEQSNPWMNLKFKDNIPPISKEESQGFSDVIGLAIRAQDYENYN